MKEAFTKENIENWLVEFLTLPPNKHNSCGARSFFYRVEKWASEETIENALDINQPGHGYTLINLYGSNGDNWKRTDLDHLPERALALLAIIHREAYEYYKQIVQAKENPDANQSRE